MNVREMTAPCGLDCFNCPNYLANDDEALKRQIQEKASSAGFPLPEDVIVCKGCRREDGLIPIRRKYGLGQCDVYKCVRSKGIESCADCSDFPCDNLQPYADCASMLPHNTKVYNLALIRKMGLEKWATEKAKSVKEIYFNKKVKL
jgi:hypothetical protein